MDRNLVFLENSAWMRYALWGAAIGIVFLATGAITVPCKAESCKVEASAVIDAAFQSSAWK